MRRLQGELSRVVKAFMNKNNLYQAVLDKDQYFMDDVPDVEFVDGEAFVVGPSPEYPRRSFSTVKRWWKRNKIPFRVLVWLMKKSRDQDFRAAIESVLRARGWSPSQFSLWVNENIALEGGAVVLSEGMGEKGRKYLDLDPSPPLDFDEVPIHVATVYRVKFRRDGQVKVPPSLVDKRN